MISARTFRLRSTPLAARKCHKENIVTSANMCEHSRAATGPARPRAMQERDSVNFVNFRPASERQRPASAPRASGSDRRAHKNLRAAATGERTKTHPQTVLISGASSAFMPMTL